MPPPHLRPPHLHPYRLFHLSARLRLRDRPSPSSNPPPEEEDYYNLLLSHPLPDPAPKTTLKPKSSNSSSSSSTPTPPPSTTPSSTTPSIIRTSPQGPTNKVLFSTPLAGPSARMRGIARGEKGLGRPPEPDNCCMSGCVNCVWDAYREEVEEWARARARRRGHRATSGVGGEERGVGDEAGEGGVGDLDGVGGLDLDYPGEREEGGLFEGVPVGIREFMSTEKRLRERRGREVGGGEGGR